MPASRVVGSRAVRDENPWGPVRTPRLGTGMSLTRTATRRRSRAAGPLAALLLGCMEPPGGEPVVITFWAMGREGEVVTGLMADFERAHPGVRVKVLQIPWRAAHQKLLTAFVGGTTPDVAQLGNTWIPEFAAIRALMPLTNRARASKVVDAQDYFPGIWQTNVIGAQLYGVPWYVDTRLLFYRRDLLSEAGFDSAPGNWPEWMHMLAAVRRRAPSPRYGVLLPLNEVEPLLALALAPDVQLIRQEEGRGNFRSAGFRRALRFYLEIFRRDLAPIATHTQISNIWNEFGRGRFVFYVGGPWYVGELKRRLEPELQQTWTTAPLPGPEGPGFSTAGSSSLVIFEASSKREAAWRLVEYLSRPAVQRAFHLMTGNLPPRRSAWRDPQRANDAYAGAFRDQLERVRPPPPLPEWERIAVEMRNVAEAAVRHGWTADHAGAELDRRADSILEKRRWMLARDKTR